MLIVEASYVRPDCPPQLIDILVRRRQLIGVFNLRLFHSPHFVDSQLITAGILVDQPANLEEVVLLKGVDRVGNVVPHLGLDLAGAIAKRERKKNVSALLGLDLLGGDKKRGGNDLVFVAGGVFNEELLHGPGEAILLWFAVEKQQ